VFDSLEIITLKRINDKLKQLNDFNVRTNIINIKLNNIDEFAGTKRVT
jgi:hypothetical protein